MDIISLFVLFLTSMHQLLALLYSMMINFLIKVIILKAKHGKNYAPTNYQVGIKRVDKSF